MNVPIGLLALPFAGAAVLCWRRLSSRVGLRWPTTLSLIALALAALCWESYFFWFHHRGQPAAVREHWFRGVEYERIVRRVPRELVAHVVRIDLDDPGIDFVVSEPPATPTGDTPAERTSEFARRTGVQLAINANFFAPFQWLAPVWYYPHDRDPVHIWGLAASRGRIYGRGGASWVTLSIDHDRSVTFQSNPATAWNAISGRGYLTRDGNAVSPPPSSLDNRLYDRAAIGVDRSGRRLIAVIVDARQPSYSMGLTIAEMSALLRELGVWTSIQLDGGGSTSLVKREGDGRVRLVNPTSNFCMPWFERAVGNHLGVRAAP